MYCDTLILQFVQYGAGLYASVGSIFFMHDRVVQFESHPCQRHFDQFAVSETCCPAFSAATSNQANVLLFHE
jgi:hypothetical protein